MAGFTTAKIKFQGSKSLTMTKIKRIGNMGQDRNIMTWQYTGAYCSYNQEKISEKIDSSLKTNKDKINRRIAQEKSRQDFAGKSREAVKLHIHMIYIPVLKGNYQEFNSWLTENPKVQVDFADMVWYRVTTYRIRMNLNLHMSKNWRDLRWDFVFSLDMSRTCRQLIYGSWLITKKLKNIIN